MKNGNKKKIMSLGWVLDYLQAIDDPSKTKVYVLTRATKDKPEQQEVRILDVHVDDGDKEVNLIVTTNPSEKSEEKTIITVSDLIDHLKDLNPKYSDYRVLTGAWMRIDQEYHARIDWPIECMGYSEEGKAVAFVERQ